VIVRAVDDRALLITQPDHAHLAGRIMEHCLALADHPRRRSILYAITEHDNGWAEEDAAPVMDPETGAVVDFVHAPLAVRHAVWPRGVERLARDPWAAALVAQHASTVYDRFRSDPHWKSFFARMRAARDGMVQASGMPLRHLVHDYAFVRLGDLISLTFCTGWSEAQRFGQWTVLRSDSRVHVQPDPFGGAVVPIAIEAQEMPKGPFASDAELRAALGGARTTVVRGQVGGKIEERPAPGAENA